MKNFIANYDLYENRIGIYNIFIKYQILHEQPNEQLNEQLNEINLNIFIQHYDNYFIPKFDNNNISEKYLFSKLIEDVEMVSELESFTNNLKKYKKYKTGTAKNDTIYNQIFKSIL